MSFVALQGTMEVYSVTSAHCGQKWEDNQPSAKHYIWGTHPEPGWRRGSPTPRSESRFVPINPSKSIPLSCWHRLYVLWVILFPELRFRRYFGTKHRRSIVLWLTWFVQTIHVVLFTYPFWLPCFCLGLVASATKHVTERDVELIEHLLVSYIKKPSCVILLTIACECTFRNRSGTILPLKYDYSGLRDTAGVSSCYETWPRKEKNHWYLWKPRSIKLILRRVFHYDFFRCSD